MKLVVSLLLLLLLLLVVVVRPTSAGPLSDPKTYDAVFRNPQVHTRLRNRLVDLFRDAPDSWQLVQDPEANEKLKSEQFAPMWNWLQSEGVDVQSILNRTDIALFENPFYLLPSGEPLRVRGMVAKGPIEAGEQLFVIPRRLFVSKHTVLEHPVLGQYVQDTSPNRDEDRKMLYIWLLYESWPSHAKMSRFRPFLETLPSMEESLEDWKQPQVLDSLLPGNWRLKNSIEEKRQFAQNLYETEIRPLFDRIAEKHDIPKELYSFDRFLWVVFHTGSRNYATDYTVDGKLIPGVSLIPFADLFNHMNQYAFWKFEESLDGYHAVTTRNYSPGQQVYCFYSHSTNDVLLRHYGFVIPTNVFHWASVKLPVPPTSRSISAPHEQLLKNIGNITFSIYPDAIDRGAGKDSLITSARVLAVSSKTFPDVQLSEALVDKAFQDELISFEVEIAAFRIAIDALNDTIRSWATSLEEDELILSKPMRADHRNLVIYRWWEKQIIVAFHDQMLQILSRLLDTSERDTLIFNGKAIYTELLQPIGLRILSNQYEEIKNLCAEKELNEDGQSATQQACNIVLKHLLSEIEIQASINIRQSVLEDYPLTMMQHQEFLTDLRKRGIQVNVTRWIFGELADQMNWGDPVTYAMLSGKDVLLEIMLQMGADPNWKSWDGVPIIYTACAMNNDKALRSLLSRGADLNALNPLEGKTCLDIATEKNNRKVLRLLGRTNLGERFYNLLLPMEKLIEKNLLVATLVILALGFVTGISLDSKKGKK